MRLSPPFSRHARWAAPGVAVAVVAGVAAGSMGGVAHAAPRLPSRTPAQLLAAAAGQGQSPPALSGTVTETASLGVPQLPGADNPSSLTSLLAGSHTIKVWYGGPAHVRLSLPVTLRETDLIRDGSTVWLWNSHTDTATRWKVPPGAGAATPPDPAATPLTPQQAARQALAAVGPSTAVTTQHDVMVAGQAAYQLALAPKSSQSLIRKVTIALDAKHLGVPLRVKVYPRHGGPALRVGYTSISFAAPRASDFSFTPPPGATVRTPAAPADGTSAGGSGQPPAQEQAGASGGSAGQQQVIGKSWLSVAVLPASALSGLTGPGNAASAAGQAARSVAGGPASGGGAGNAAVAGALLKAATHVHGQWGRGRLLRTRLLSILITSNGKVLVGAVQPAVLYHAAAQLR